MQPLPVSQHILDPVCGVQTEVLGVLLDYNAQCIQPVQCQGHMCV